MKIVKSYVAFDDTMFDTEKECQEYEDKKLLTKTKPYIHLFDEEFNELIISDPDSRRGIVEKIAHFKCDNVSAFEEFRNWYEGFGYCGFEDCVFTKENKTHIWSYDKEAYTFIDVQEKIVSLQNIVDHFN